MCREVISRVFLFLFSCNCAPRRRIMAGQSKTKWVTIISSDFSSDCQAKTWVFFFFKLLFFGKLSIDILSKQKVKFKSTKSDNIERIFLLK